MSEAGASATAAEPSHHHAASHRGLRGNPMLTLLSVALGVMMVALDGTIVAVANPSIQAHLHASLAGIQWVTNGYLLSLAVTLITIGKFGDRFGHRRIFLIGVVGFGLSSAAIGLSGDIAGNLGLIIAFRVLLGIFGAMLQPTALALLRNTFPAHRLNSAIGIWGAVLGASTAAGPIVGGLLVQHINWEACFYVNVPVGIIALVVGALVLKETPPSPARSFDVTGIALLSVTLFLLVFGLIKASAWGWGSGKTIGFFAGAAVGLALFILRERQAREPLLPLRLFRSVPLSAGVVLVILLMFALFGAMFFMTFYLENVHGYDPVKTGLWLLPMTAMLIVGSPISGWVLTKIGPKIPLCVGMIFAAVALFGLSRLTATSDPSNTILWFVLLGLGLSPVIVGATDVIVGNASRELAGVASGLQSTAMQLGGTLGTAILGSIMSARVESLLPARWAAASLPHRSGAQLGQVESAVEVGVAPVTKGVPAGVAAAITRISHDVFTSGMQTAFVVAGVVAAAGALVALLTRRPDEQDEAAPTASPAPAQAAEVN
ncbi:MAG TPA: DHA2 family efflux MFS transporter permease subunit [Streptosporangiaceae bacterium]|nr:DHA2 family efflux MFS transporter permease subunit [Streptosporangiaceae bacterium]